jgi:hypothetical protein
MTLYQYSGSGSLNESSEVNKNRSFSYNRSSVYLYVTEDFGGIGIPPQPNGFSNNSIDFSQTTHTFDEIVVYEEVDIDDYGNLTTPTSETDDYGPIAGFGSTETLYPFGGLTLSGSAITQPNYRLYISGSATTKLSLNLGSLGGTLFTLVDHSEKISYSYNLSSVKVFSSDDYGGVTLTSTSSEDYGILTESPGGGQEDYEFISGSTAFETIYPFGKLTLNGSAITQSNYRLYLSGSSQSKLLKNYQTSGSLFSFGEKLESVTYDYNIESIETSYPFGNIQIYGVGDVSFEGNYITSGLFNISGSATDAYSAQTPENTQPFTISGSASSSDVDVYVGIGTLFSVGEKVESVTYDYNIDSINPNPPEDFGLVSVASTETSDWGLIVSTVDDGIDNYGLLIGNPFTTLPFGTITLSGYSLLSFQKGPFIPSGSIVFSGFGGVESFTAQTPDNTQLFQISGTSLEKDVDSYVGLGTIFLSDQSTVVEIDSYNGSGSIIISGSAIEKDVDSYVGLGTIFLSDQSIPVEIDSYTGSGSIFISGTSVEKDIDSYVGIGTLVISSSVIESELETYVGLGTLSISGIATERVTFNPPENTQLFQISGTAVEKDVDSYSGLGTIFISGELRHPNIDYTPHYGIEKNIGIGTTGIQLYGTAFEAYSSQTPENTQLFQISGIATERVTFNPPENTQLFTISGAYNNLKSRKSYVGTGGTITISAALVEKDVDSYVGLGTIFLSGVVNDSAQRITRGTGSIFINGLGTESRTIFIPTSGIGTGFIGGTISIFNEVTRYYSPIYPKNSGIIGSGIGTIRINDDKGLTITRAVLPYFARGTIVLSGVGDESFSITNYDGSGLITLSGISSNREIAVYTEVGSGLITFTSQTLVESNVDAYSGSGSIIISGTSDNRKTNNYRGTGSITFLSGASESLTSQTPENTQLFNISGSAAEVYSAQTPETEVLYQFNGNLVESRTYGYEGSGQATFGSAAVTIFEPRVFGVGLFKFTTHLSDNLYDTCDSLDITCDYQDSALVKFVANPSETTILFNLSGSALTKEIQVYTSSGSGIVGISGSSVLKKTKSFVGIGTLSITSTTVEKDIDSYVGSGSITILSGSAKSRVSVPQKSTILLSISGTSSTKVSKLKRYSGIGTAYFNGSASTKKLSRPSYSGIGTILLSGQLVYPNIKYIPAPKGAGVISINGSGLEQVGRRYLSVIQPLFFFSGGFESFSGTGYIGIGTIYIQSTSASTINNPFQIQRVYVTII